LLDVSLVQLSRVLVALAAALALAGCGTSTDRAQVRVVTSGFFAALDAHHADQACARLSQSLARTIEEERSASRCADAVTTVPTRSGAIVEVHVYATSARADLSSGESVFLGLSRVGWRIDAFGCRSQPSGPYDCEEQG
jgi:hypothetical protein